MIETDFLHQLDRFNVVLKKKIHSQYSGFRETKITGQGMVFKDYKDYVAGDDFRAIDWKVYARTDDFYIRRYEEERNMTVHVVIDASASMNFGKQHTKYEYASMLGLGFAYIAMRNNERFEISTFADDLEILKPSKGKGMIVGVLDQLNRARLTGKSEIYESLLKYKQAIKTKSMVVIISDFLFNADQLREALYLFKRSEVFVVQVLDESEITLDLDGDVILKDSESASIFKTFISNRFKKNYEAELHEHIVKVKNVCDSLGLNFIQVSTGTPIFETFYKLLR